MSGFQLMDGASGYAAWATANAGGQAANPDFNHDGVHNGVAYFTRFLLCSLARTRSSPAHRLSVAATSDSSLSVAALSLHSPSLGSGLQESVETSGAKQSPSPPCPANDSIRAMTITPDPEETARLEALANQAKGYALHMMRSTGSVPPTVIADTAEGFVFCVPSGLPDDAAKDRFADTARLLAVAHGARAIAMVVEPG